MLCYILCGAERRCRKRKFGFARNATQDKLNSIMSNGEVHGNISNDGTQFPPPAELRDFLSSGSGKGYLTNDINNFFWDDNRLTSTLSSVNMTELNGNGYKIALTATNVASNPSKAHRYRSLPQAIRVALVGRCLCRRSLQVKILSIPITSMLHGGLIGFLRNYQTIKNCNFVYSGNIDTSYATNCSGTMGLIAALSLGTIDNCSLTVNGKIKYYSDTTWNGNIGTVITAQRAERNTRLHWADL